MKDVPELRAHLREIAATAPTAKPIDARARRRIRVRQSTLIAVTASSVVALVTTGFALGTRDAAVRSSDERSVAGEKASTNEDCVWKIATLGAFSGNYAPIGKPVADAIEYAVEESNRHGGLACRVELRAEDSQGNPNLAPAPARSLVDDARVVACICPYYSGETLASGAIFSSGGLLMTGTATNETLDEQGFRTWFGAAAPDDVQGEITGEFIASTGADNVAVVDDGQEYSTAVAAGVRAALGDRATPLRIDVEKDDRSRVVEEVAAMDADFVFFAGYSPEAGPLIKQLREAGVDALFMTGPGSRDPVFGRLAGEAAEGALAMCPCADPTKIDVAAPFVTGMRETYGEDSPGTFAVEAYDVTTLVVEALRTYGGDPADTQAVRAHVVAHFRNTKAFDGLAKTYSWQADGELDRRPDAVWVYEWDSAEGGFVSRGPVSDYLE